MKRLTILSLFLLFAISDVFPEDFSNKTKNTDTQKSVQAAYGGVSRVYFEATAMKNESAHNDKVENEEEKNVSENELKANEDSEELRSELTASSVALVIF